MIPADLPPKLWMPPALILPAQAETLDRGVARAGVPRQVRRAIDREVARRLGARSRDILARVKRDADQASMPVLLTLLAARRRAAPGGGGGNDANTLVLIQNEGKADASTVITNTAVGGSAAFTAVGPAQVDTDVSINGRSSILFGEGSGVLFDGSDASLTFAGDFTIEFFVWTMTSSGDGAFQRRILDLGSSHIDMLIDNSPAGVLVTTAGTSTATIHDGSPHHVVIKRNGTALSLWIDENMEASSTNSSTFTGSATSYLGRYHASANGNFIGNLGQIRFSNVDRYPEGVTAPVAPF